MGMTQMIRIAGEASIDRIVVDKKQYLFEAELNAQLGISNIDTCKQLLKICPEYIPAYMMLRKEALELGLVIEQDDDEENALITAFNDTTVSGDDFKAMLEKADKNSPSFKLFSSNAKIISDEC